MKPISHNMFLCSSLRSRFPGIIVDDAYDYFCFRPHWEVKFFVAKNQAAGSNDFYIWTSATYTRQLMRLMRSLKKVYNPRNESSPFLFVDGTSNFFNQDLDKLVKWIYNLKSKRSDKV